VANCQLLFLLIRNTSSLLSSGGTTHALLHPAPITFGENGHALLRSAPTGEQLTPYCV